MAEFKLRKNEIGFVWKSDEDELPLSDALAYWADLLHDVDECNIVFKINGFSAYIDGIRWTGDNTDDVLAWLKAHVVCCPCDYADGVFRCRGVDDLSRVVVLVEPSVSSFGMLRLVEADISGGDLATVKVIKVLHVIHRGNVIALPDLNPRGKDRDKENTRKYYIKDLMIWRQKDAIDIDNPEEKTDADVSVKAGEN
jgi:hypothetical protein